MLQLGIDHVLDILGLGLMQILMIIQPNHGPKREVSLLIRRKYLSQKQESMKNPQALMEKVSEYDLGDRQELLLLLIHEDMNSKHPTGRRDLCSLMSECLTPI